MTESRTSDVRRPWAIHHTLDEDGAPSVRVGAQIDFAVQLSATVRWLSTIPGQKQEPTLPTVTETDGHKYEVISAIDDADGVDMGPFRAYLPDALSHPALAGEPARFRGQLELVHWMEGSSPTESAPAEFIRTWNVERILASCPGKTRRGDFVMRAVGWSVSGGAAGRAGRPPTGPAGQAYRA